MGGANLAPHHESITGLSSPCCVTILTMLPWPMHVCLSCYNIIITCLHDEDSSQYAHYVFAALDREQSGTITFRDFMLGLSIVMKGTLQERLRWAFS